MVCPACNAEIGPDVRFCPKCGAPVLGHAPPPQNVVSGYPPDYAPALASRPRFTRHLQSLGVLWCVSGAYRLAGGLIGMFFLNTFATHGFGEGGWPFGRHGFPFSPGSMTFLLPVIAIFTIASAAVAFATGYSLLSRRPWGRTLAIIAAVLALFKFPVGTAMGIYTLWVLTPADSAIEYDTTTRPLAPL